MVSPRRNGGNIVKDIEKRKREERPTNKYYEKVARYYGYAKYATLVLLAVLIVYVFTAYSEYITYDNLMYLIKDFGTEASADGAYFTTVKYEERKNASYGIFDGELAVLGNGGLSLYSTSGKKTLDSFLSYSSPTLELSDKYILAYDLGGKDYSLFTSVARITSRTADHTIMGGAASDSGAYALITRSSTSKFKVNLYSSSLNLAATYYKDTFVADIALSGDGKNIVIASFDISGYDFKTEISLCSSHDKEPLSTVRINGVCPYRVEYLGDNGYFVICDTCVLFFDMKGELVSRFDYGGSVLSSSSHNDDSLLLVLAKNSVGNENNVLLLDKKGREIYTMTVDGQIKDASLSDGNTAYLLMTDSVRRITTEQVSESEEYDGRSESIIAFDKYALTVSPSRAEPVFAPQGKKAEE